MRVRLYAALLRLDKPIGIWLLVLPCWWGVLLYSPTLSLETLRLCALFLLGACAMRSAGCILNDITDRHIDAQVERTKTRPLASGAMRVQEAWFLLGVTLLMATCVALGLGWKIFLLGCCWLPLVIAYPFMKRITWWPQAFLGITFGAGGLFGMVATNGTWQLSGMLLYIATIFWVIGYDTIYACQDKIEDARIGVKSTALLFGKNVRYYIALCYGVMLCGIAGAFIIEQVRWGAWVGYCIAALLLLQQILRFRPEHAPSCAYYFRYNLWVGIALAGGLLGSRL